MAYFPKLLTRPRLQLMVLMLILLATLSPKNSMAEDDSVASPDAPAAPTADNAAAAGRSSNASGEAVKPAVKCYKDECGFTPDKEKCFKAPDSTTPTEECGTCFHRLETEKRKEGKSFVTYASALRRCATPAEVTCIEGMRRGGGCLKTTDTADATKYKECVRKANITGGGGYDGYSIYVFALYFEVCFCDSDLCNNRTSSGPTGAKHLGYNYNVVIVGALLVAGLPLLRSLFLVG